VKTAAAWAAKTAAAAAKTAAAKAENKDNNW
jgi:hypothetical protein